MQSVRLGLIGNTDEREQSTPRPQPGPEEAHMAFILVIDDHGTSLDAFAAIIRSGGHEVITARNEDEACRGCEHHAAPDLLILDVKLRGSPQRSGVAKDLTSFYPGARVVFTSGTPLDGLRTDGLLDL